jgi:hypothetical protein
MRENVTRFVVEEGERMQYCLQEACGFLRQRTVAADDVRPSGVFGHLGAETQPSTSTRKRRLEQRLVALRTALGQVAGFKDYILR